MACFHPLRAYVRPKGCGTVRGITVAEHAEFRSQKALPCGRCIGCRLERARQWAVRCVHEASLYDRNCFLTLTYDESHLPSDSGLHVRDWQLFMKRLRKGCGRGIRFFAAGEYGSLCKACGLPSPFSGAPVRCVCRVFVESLGRPHFHAVVFNHDFADKVLVSVRNGNRFYSSEQLASLWPAGFSSIGDVTFESAGYVARYTMEKVVGDSRESRALALERYQGKKKEFCVMSRRPGIGSGWFEKFKSDVFPSDEMVVNGVVTRVPRFYDNLLDKENPALLKRLKEERKLRADRESVTWFMGRERKVSENSVERLKAREGCLKARVSKLVRGGF